MHTYIKKNYIYIQKYNNIKKNICQIKKTQKV